MPKYPVERDLIVFPERIYLIGDGDDVMWCEDPAPGPNMDPDDAVMYIRADKVIAHPKGGE